MKKKAEITQVVAFASDETVLAVLEKSQRITVFDVGSLNQISSWHSTEKLDNRIYVDDGLIWVNTLYAAHGLLIKENEMVEVPRFVKSYWREAGGFASFEMVLEGERKMNLKTFDGQIVWTVEGYFLPYLVLADVVLCRRDSQKTLYALSNHTGEQLWAKHFSEEIYSFLGRKMEIVWVVLDSGRIVGLHFLTGEEVISFDKPTHYPASWSEPIQDPMFFLGRYTQIDTIQNKLFGLRGWNYWEINLANPIESYTLYNLEEHFKYYQMEANAPFLPVLDKNRLFFGSIDRKGPTVGIFDRHQKEIVWASSEAMTDSYLPSVRQIAYQNNQLFVLDGTGVLHIFQD